MLHKFLYAPLFAFAVSTTSAASGTVAVEKRCSEPDCIAKGCRGGPDACYLSAYCGAYVAN